MPRMKQKSLLPFRCFRCTWRKTSWWLFQQNTHMKLSLTPGKQATSHKFSGSSLWLYWKIISNLFTFEWCWRPSLVRSFARRSSSTYQLICFLKTQNRYFPVSFRGPTLLLWVHLQFPSVGRYCFPLPHKHTHWSLLMISMLHWVIIQMLLHY